MPALDRHSSQLARPLAALLLVCLVVTGCAGGSAPSSPAGGSGAASQDGSVAAGNQAVVKISLTDAGCPAVPTTIGTGPVRFEIVNDGASTVSELEITEGDRILGEKENLVQGLSGTFSLDLAAGEYGVRCPNAATEQTTLVVTALADASAPDAQASAAADSRLSAALEAATIGYGTYVREQTATLVDAATAFAAAVEAGDVEKARALYPAARIPYERIEPVAESFGDLDPAIDNRIADVADPATWTGFHRIEKALWIDHTTEAWRQSPASSSRHRQAQDLGRHRRLPAGPARKRCERAARRGRPLEGHRRGRGLLADRPGRLRSQRRRGEGSIRAARARPSDRRSGDGDHDLCPLRGRPDGSGQVQRGFRVQDVRQAHDRRRQVPVRAR